MSKRFITFLIGTVIIFIGSVVIAQSKKIDEPILIPIGKQSINVESEVNNFSLSYITNRNESIRVAMVYVGEEVLNAIDYQPISFFKNEITNPYTRVKSYTYYDLHEQQVELKDFQLESVRNYLQQGEMVKVIFSNGTMLDYPLTLDFYKYDEDNTLIEVENTLQSDNGQSETQFTFKEAVIIEGINSTFSNPMIRLYKGEQELTLPYEAQPQEKLTLRISPNERLGYSIVYLAYIYGTKLTGEAFSQQLSVQAGDIPSEEWIFKKVGEY